MERNFLDRLKPRNHRINSVVKLRKNGTDVSLGANHFGHFFRPWIVVLVGLCDCRICSWLCFTVLATTDVFVQIDESVVWNHITESSPDFYAFSFLGAGFSSIFMSYPYCFLFVVLMFIIFLFDELLTLSSSVLIFLFTGRWLC